MKQEKMDMKKVLAILAQPRKPLPPLENVKRKTIDVPYISKQGIVTVRPLRLTMPSNTVYPIPLVYVPHYEMGEDTLEIRAYLEKGWAVASAKDFNDTYNAQLTDDDLVFNCAAIYTLRRMPEIDAQRIVLVGGSAGGYCTLMLNGLKLGLCASIANGPITNVYFNFQHHFKTIHAMNLEKLAQMKKAGKVEQKSQCANQLEILKMLECAPVPFITALYGIFAPVLENFPDKKSWERWQEHSPIGMADRFSSPIMVNHNTSDILVPADQITKRFTYCVPGESLPADLDLRLPQGLPGRLSLSLEECLPPNQTQVNLLPYIEQGDAGELPFDEKRRFCINMVDDGAPEGYGTHSSKIGGAHRDDRAYLARMIELSAAKTNTLTPAMLRSQLLRYLGRDSVLPAHIGVDDTVYGSLAVYREEVKQELGEWLAANDAEQLQAVLGQMPCQTEEEHTELIQTMKEILTQIETHA